MIREELYVPEPDQFEREAPLQPKRTVAEYAATVGILVPTIYADLDEARHAAANGTRVLARSEHPDDYAGPSGLGYTAELLDDGAGDMRPNYTLYTNESVQDRLRFYARTAGLDPEAYVANTSVSYWQKIPGINITVVADDVLRERYHIFGYDGDTKSGTVTTEDGGIIRTTDTANKLFNPQQYAQIIKLYNTVRRLPKFNDFHCPIIEMQQDPAGQLYFLQYHRARDASSTPDQLNYVDFDAREGWLAADAVRGAYVGAQALKLTLWYRNSLTDTGPRVTSAELPDDGYLGMDGILHFLNEYMGRQRIAHIIPSNFNSEYKRTASSHGSRSQLFKPRVAILTGRSIDDILPEELTESAFRRAYFGGHRVCLKTEVVSDGRNAFLRYGNELIVD